MTIKEFAKSINRREHEYQQFTKEELQIAKENKWVIIYGHSDDLMELEGAIYDEAGVFDGGIVHTTSVRKRRSSNWRWSNKQK